MANMKFANNANTTLASSLTAIATSMSVTSATKFPVLIGAEYFYCTLTDVATQTVIEIVKVTATSGTTWTIVRGQDGTTGAIFAAGDVVSLRLVRASLDDFPKLDEVNTFTSVQTFSSQPILSSLTASSAVATDASKGLVSVTNTGSGNNVLATSPTITGATLTTAALNGTLGATTPSSVSATSISNSGDLTFTSAVGKVVMDSNAKRAYITGGTVAGTTTGAYGIFEGYDYGGAGAGGGIQLVTTTGTTAPITMYTKGEERFKVGTASGFVWNIAVPNTATATVGIPTTGTSPTFAVSIPTHNTYYPASFYISGSYASNISTAEIHAVGVKYSGWGSAISFSTSNGTSESEKMRIFKSGGVSIGNTTDPGATNLSVTGKVTATNVTSNTFTGYSGATASTPSGTPVTLINTTSYVGYLVMAFVLGGNTAFMATATVINDGTGVGIFNYAHGAYLTLTISGTNIQATQSSGANNAIQYRIIPIA